METADVRVLREARAWHAAGHRLLLATVVKTWGASPRPVGSMMALREDGRCVGSVSGGCIEDDLIHRYTRAYGGGAMAQASPQRVRYGVTADEAHRFGLPCGGTLELLLEFQPDFETLDALVGLLESGQLVQRSVCVATGAVTLTPVSAPEAARFDGVTLCCTLGPQYRMLLIGAGILAEYLATMALFNDFSVTVCDPRKEHLGNWSVPGVHVTQEMPDDAVLALAPDRRTCVVALSHDPKLDDLALLEALHSPAFYVGAIGSLRNTSSRRQRFIDHFGETAASLERLHAPVGIYIGSKTPAEIAVSIMAEILAVKNGVALPAAFSVEAAKRRLAASVE
ncbi:XdhC family protein [Bordetella hinzii]|uniref:Cytochrome oxidase I n=1 Tax=Bordetella hinzii TaxID=103855 RepID=A0AAN1RTD7_9BORD|nr:XdhC family protein [Bordetella hinzii]AKQ54488.1 putative xanthine dehydrogenase subunit A [Bordetella hinzii]AKQ59000.1 putative xanthine dehydrogenase subunit A [Bordetella hinzii]AZW15726.1 cytochrome oxidase I [Bordetella hinzii]KCB32802.1 putative xanthine dehydrogenase accessory factor [Bordetella hinzii L60]KCB33461.1 putative xanthine dehydrogenase accessory factor [Bordetella hinzii CA90 BAL1384]